MTPDQFQIPNSLEESIDPELVRAVEEVFEPFEVAEASAYTDIKTIEAELSAFHSLATDENLPELSLVDRVLDLAIQALSKSKQRTLDDKLVDAESLLSAKLFGERDDVVSQRFWHHDGDWFYEVKDSVGIMVARYQFTEATSFKIVDGLPTHFVKTAELDEKANVVKMIHAYHALMQREMYANLSPNKDNFDLAA